MLAICGAAGHIGSKVAGTLLSQGQKVTVIGRNRERLEPFIKKGADAAVGSLDDPKFVESAFKGSDAVMAMIPPNPTTDDIRAFQGKIGETIVEAIRKSGVKYVVHISSIGAHLSEGVGPVNGLHDQEQRLNKLEGVNVLHLRCGYFMENLLGMVGLIKSQGMFGSTIKPNTPVPMIATRDIAAEVVKGLTKRHFNGKQVKYILGSRDVSMSEAATILGKAVDKPGLKFVHFPTKDARAGMVGAGLSPAMADSYIEMSEALDEGRMTEDFKRSPENSTPTSFEDFARSTFSEIYFGKAKTANRG
jgi:uncharacterized protein YbjT (DUF2867 family)